MKLFSLAALFSASICLFAQDSTSSNKAPEPLPVPPVDVASFTLTNATGTVEVKKNGSDAWVALAQGSAFSEKDAIKTGAASDAEITLPDSSVLKLKENSSFEIDVVNDTIIYVQKQGAIFYKITPVASAHPPIKVGTPTATALVYGTAFATTVKDANNASFAVVQGKIGVKGSSGEEVFIKAGEFSRATSGAVDKPKKLPAEGLKRLEEWSKVDFKPYPESASENKPQNDNASIKGSVSENKASAKKNENAEKPVEKKADAPAGGKKGEGVQWSVGMGSVTVDGKQWNRLSLRPDIPIGKFGICLDIELFVDDQGNISNKGWNFDNAANTFESIQRKIYYIRYGHQGETFYAKVGALDNVTLGYGFILSGYSNSLQYPDIRKTGLHTELNDISFLGIGFQGVINNFSDFNRDGALIGTRLSVKPLKTMSIPILSNLDVGATYVTDMNQRAVLRDRDNDKVPDLLDRLPDDKKWAIEKTDYSVYDTSKPNVKTAVNTLVAEDLLINQAYVDKYKGYIEGKDPFSIVGADIGLPILSNRILSLLLYGQWATDADDKNNSDFLHSPQMKGWGIAAPGVGVGIGPLKINVEYRFFKDEFQGEYFDETYELDRMKQLDPTTLSAKETFLSQFDSTTMSGIFSKAGLNIFNIINAGAGYQWMKIKYSKIVPEGTPTADQSFNATASTGETIKNILRKVKIDDVSAYYSKKRIGTWAVDAKTNGDLVYDKFLAPTPFVLMGYKVGFQLAQSMVLYWDTQYTYAVDPTETNPFHLKLNKRLNIETVLKF